MTTQASHTPGKWSYDHQGIITSADGTTVAQVFDNADNGSEPMGEEPSLFNCALIAAAPNMLNALIAVSRLDYLQEHNTLAEKVRAAITLATSPEDGR